MTRRNDVKNSFIFNTAGHGSGIWTGGGITKTSPSRTLFVTAIPEGVEMRAIERLFQPLPGFVGFRTVRHMAFVDFENDRGATSAMRKYQNYVFPGQRTGLLIDYDKDPVSKRNRSYEMELQSIRVQQDERDSLRYYCSKCRTRCLTLHKAKALQDMPQRSTDSAYCVNEEKYLKSLNVVKGEETIVRREKGLEKQFPLNCSLCDSTVAYRPVPIGEPTKFLYVLSGALTSDPRVHSAARSVIGAVSAPESGLVVPCDDSSDPPTAAKKPKVAAATPEDS